MMDGDIRVDSSLGRGTRFTVTIHLKFVPEDSSLPQVLCGLPVLLADDDKDTCESTCILLREIGLDAEWRLTGQRAVEIEAEARALGVTHFLTKPLFKSRLIGSFRELVESEEGDTQTEPVGSYEAARAIRGSGHPDADTIPIVAMTANAFAEDAKQSLASGMNEHLTKPVNLEELRRVLDACLGRG